MSSIRIQRFESELQKLISQFISQRLRDKDLSWISISAVKLSPDLSHARIYFTHLSNVSHKKVEEALKRSTSRIKREIAQSKMMRIVPELSFFYDDMEEKAEHLEEIFHKIHQEKQIEEEEEQNETT